MFIDQINYPHIIDQAMRGVVRDVLRKVQVGGLPANHHFFISFSTQHPDVKMSEQLRAKYPKEITIVMQHQFWDFKVEQNSFNVTMSFGGVPEKLVIPFASLISFADPSIRFGLQFQAPDFLEDASAEIVATSPIKSEEKVEQKIEIEDAGEKIISLDSFRKK